MTGGQEYKHSNKGLDGGFWLEPTIIYYGASHPKTMEEETFAPILRKWTFCLKLQLATQKANGAQLADVATFKTLEEAIELNNSVRQGLSSSLFTKYVHYTNRMTKVIELMSLIILRST